MKRYETQNYEITKFNVIITQCYYTVNIMYHILHFVKR